jgi:hypothetical protein
MQATVIALCLPKAGNRADECEDALYPAAGGERAGDCLRFAVADGASEALLSGPWAALLARRYGRQPVGDEPADWLQLAHARWARWLRRYLRRRERRGRPIQWFEEPGLEAGAFAALLGLTLREAGEAGAGDWQALALGDSCLFQTRAGALVTGFPAVGSADFGSRPLLLGSRPARNARALDAIATAWGRWQVGDRFYLMTDALAHWWLREHEAGRAPWAQLDRPCGPRRSRSFPRWVETRRRRRELRNDDIALLRIEITAGSVAGCPGPN